MEIKAKLVGVASLLLCVSFASEALTLGRIRGAALIGKPLDMVVQIQTEPGEDAASLCFEAEVFHADVRQDPSRVQVLIESTPEALSGLVRVRSLSLIDEPIVSLYLRTSCGQKTSRRYVLLADLASEVDPPVVAQLMAATRAVAARPIPDAPSKSLPAARVASARRSAESSPVGAPVARKVKAATPPPPKPVVSAKTAGQPRLTLDSLELLTDRVSTLEAAPPAAPPEAVLRDSQKMQSLEGDVKALLALAAKNEANLTDLRARLQQAEAERFPTWVIYALSGLVLACLALMAWMWTRLRRGQEQGDDWWSASVAVMPPLAAAEAVREATSAPQPAAQSGLASSAASTAVKSALPTGPMGLQSGEASPLNTQVDVSLMEMSESSFDNLMTSGAAHSAIRTPTPSPAPASALPASMTTHGVRNINSGTVFDVRQQAEFFVSLGQTDQAVRILEKQIGDSDEPNPHVYLDLLNLFHSLSLKIDFRQFRDDFNLLFNGKVPEFASFKNEGNGLTAYPDVLAGITSRWPTVKAVEFLESLIYRDPWDTNSQPFDLCAFREILLLHALVQRILQAGGADTPSGSVSATPTYFSDSGFGVPVATKLPEPDAEADLPLDLMLNDEPAALEALDLDLSQGDADPALDVVLPPEAPAALPDPGNLIDFDLSSLDDLPDLESPAKEEADDAPKPASPKPE